MCRGDDEKNFEIFMIIPCPRRIDKMLSRYAEDGRLQNSCLRKNTLKNKRGKHSNQAAKVPNGNRLAVKRARTGS